MMSLLFAIRGGDFGKNEDENKNESKVFQKNPPEFFIFALPLYVKAKFGLSATLIQSEIPISLMLKTIDTLNSKRNFARLFQKRL